MDEYDFGIVSKFPTSRTVFDHITNDTSNYYNSYCYEAIRNYPYDPTNFLKTCLFFIKGLMYLHKNKDTETSTDTQDVSTHDHCEYLIYRLNYELEHIMKYPKSVSSFYDNMKTQVQGMISKLNTCKNEFKNLDITVLNNIHALNEMHENLNKLMYNFPYKEETCNNAGHYVKLYNKYISICYSSMDSSFCKELKKLGENYNEYIKEKIIKCPKLENRFLYTGSNNTRTEVTDVQPCETSLRRELVEDGINSSPIVHDTETPLGHKIFTGFSISLSILLILFIMYKFTSFGTRLSTKILNIKGILFDEDEESNPTFPSASQNKHTNSKKKGYRITYNSIQKS
ncbi:PIR Superfamily Protein [Plasmodium ovale wallikeri]|uniref:PIR protein n=2 Tax=Plasmodium ovale TaxID=36330 RepID=A0A1C3KFU5_PLAOA|nr:PIR Superfamily Protein [Plasmodium ovale wallikeri]SBT72532.1 PIR protein [Plasmodium ovale]